MKVSLFLFIDALGWEVLERHPGFLASLNPERRPLKTIFGYSSACDPSIISGVLPQEHGLWSSFYYDPVNCPYKWLRHLRFLPAPLVNYHKVRHQLSRGIAKVHGFTGYFQIYNVPFDRLPYFDYAEKRRIWEPGGLPSGLSLFDLMASAQLPYRVDDSASSDSVKIDRAEAAIKSGSQRVIYLLLGELDRLMHAVGPNDPQVSRLMDWYDRRLSHLIRMARRRYSEVDWMVFSDHGMHAVQGHYNLQADIERLGLAFGIDYVAIYDSTMARFWFLKDEARERIMNALSSIPQGRVVSDDELKAFGTFFPDHKYGEIIFLMQPPIMIAPSDMGRKQIAGMHGFHPDDPPSWASVISPHPLPQNISQIHHLFHQMKRSAGLK